MKAKKVNEALNENRGFIPFDRNPYDLKQEYPDLFGTLSFSIIANALQNNLTPNLFVQGKLDLNRFYNFISNFRGYQPSFEKMKENLMKAAPLLGITEYLKLTREEKSNLKFQERILSGEQDFEYYTDAEIPVEEATLPSDYVVRSMYGETEPAYYRFDKDLDLHGINMMKAAYAYKYGDPEKNLWRNYLDARPATIGHIQKHGKSVEFTQQYGDFMEKEYN